MNSIQEKFKKKKRNQIVTSIVVSIIFAIVMFVGLLATRSIGGTGHKSYVLIVIYAIVVAVAIIIGFLIFTLINWRCPNCNKFLGRFIKSCKSCGEKLV